MPDLSEQMLHDRMFGPCPKCEFPEAEVSWRPSNDLFGCRVRSHTAAEHLDVTCSRCGYCWAEPASDQQASLRAAFAGRDA